MTERYDSIFLDRILELIDQTTDYKRRKYIIEELQEMADDETKVDKTNGNRLHDLIFIAAEYSGSAS